jgi:drug/metabolite transporter (DMT)-like permease
VSLQPPVQLRLGAAEYGLIALQSMLWGSTYFFVALAQDGMPPWTTSALRLVPAGGILLLVVWWFGLRLPATLAEWARVFIFSVFNNALPFVLIVHAQREVTGGTAAVFNATAPLFTVFLAAMLIPEERLSWRRVAGIALGIVGVAVLIGFSPADTSGGLMSRVLLVAAASCYAIANVYARLSIRGYAPFALACAQMIGALAISAVLAALLEQPWTMPRPSPETFLAVLAMGVFGSAFASLCHFTVLQRAGATNATLVTIILPLTPILLGAVFLGERMSAREIAGGLIIASALIVIDGRVLQWMARAIGGRRSA